MVQVHGAVRRIEFTEDEGFDIVSGGIAADEAQQRIDSVGSSCFQSRQQTIEQSAVSFQFFELLLDSELSSTVVILILDAICPVGSAS